MIRAPLGDMVYWTGRVDRISKALAEDVATRDLPSANPDYEPQFWFDHAKYCARMILLRYSRGDAPQEYRPPFAGVLDAWELSNKLSHTVCQQKKIQACRDWDFDLSNLNHYNWCFWLVGLALALEIPDDQWQRLVELIDDEGKDELLDRVIASRQPNRAIGARLLHPKPYARLHKAVSAPKEDQAHLLRDFVEHWYAELARKGKEELWWYVYGDPVKHPLSMGSYFGRWCIEAVAAVKAFGIDDSLCQGHEHYPGDLLRPDGPTTHVQQRTEGANPTGLIGRLTKRLIGR